jgi:tetratricopeptide (TPR) repeat protein
VIGRVVADRYRVDRALGDGAAVFLARDLRLDRDVVIELGAAGSAAVQALARLSHPNVVVVYEVGEVDDRAFVAREHVAGATARAWLEARPRTAAQIVALYADAGAGLAAAHAAGLAHGAFGADHVLVGDDGRPRVIDVALAIDGDRRDALADQRAFCATLRDALRATAATAPRAPRHVDAALRRGLHDDPARRWPSMAALVAELRRDPARRRRAALLGGSLAVAAAAAVIVPRAVRAPSVAPCSDDEAALAPTWSDARAGAVERALGAAGGAAAWRDLRPRVDRYAHDWIAAHHDACKATRLDGTQSADMLDRRMLCLDRARLQLDAILERLGAGGPAAVENAPNALAILPDLGTCANLDELSAEALPPADPAMRAKIDAANREIIRVRTATSWGVKDGVSTGDRIAAAAEATAWPPLVGEARRLRAELLLDAQEADAGRMQLQDAADYALRNGLDELAADCMTDLAQSLLDGSRAEQAAPWVATARGLWTRIGKPPMLGSRIARAQSNLDYVAGDLDAMLADTRTLVALARQAEGEDPADHFNLANAYENRGQNDDAAKEIAAGIALVQARFGPDHPMMIDYLAKAAEIDFDRLHNDDAIAFARRAVAAGEKWYGPDDVHVAGALELLGASLAKTADRDSARAAIDRAMRILEAHTPDSAELDRVVYIRADFEGRIGDYAAAAADAARVIARIEQRAGAEAIGLISPLELLGISDRHLGRLDESARALERAIAIGTKTMGPGSWLTINDESELSYTRIPQGRARDAAALLEPVMPLLEPGVDVPAPVIAESHQAYADALWRAGGDRARARAHATQARDRYAALGADFEEQRRASEAWLAAHGVR